MKWIATDNIYAETWRELSEYTNIDLVCRNLESKHGLPLSQKERENRRKQAQQARVCVLQAKEYMEAARSSSIFTSPNHTYYSISSLASLLMLVLGDGKNSLDYLRKDKKNRTHGLNFRTTCTLANASSGVNLLRFSSAEILENGQFANWYRILPKRDWHYALHREIIGKKTKRSVKIVGGSSLAEFSSISRRSWILLDLLALFPDLDLDLRKCGVQKVRSRSNLEVFEDGAKTRFSWAFSGTENGQELKMILDKFVLDENFKDRIRFDLVSDGSGGLVHIDCAETDQVTFHWPDFRETLDHSMISYADPIEMFEIVDLYLVAYQLSMLSRYFPDLWVRCIESQCLAAKLISRATELIGRKFPILCLSLLNGEKTVISTYRAPWLTQ